MLLFSKLYCVPLDCHLKFVQDIVDTRNINAGFRFSLGGNDLKIVENHVPATSAHSHPTSSQVHAISKLLRPVQEAKQKQRQHMGTTHHSAPGSEIPTILEEGNLDPSYSSN